MSPDEIREKGLFPKGFLPLPHPNHPEGGMVFPKMMIDELIKMGEGNRLERFDLDFDLPEHFLPEFPPAMFLTTRPDLGDVSQGKVITLDNLNEMFNGVLNPKQLEGLRLLLTQFPQQQFNITEDRRTERPSRGVTCLDCHVNGHTNGGTHLVGDIRPQAHRRRIDTPPCAESISSAFSVRSARCDRSRTSPSSSSAPPTSTAIRSSPPRKASTRWSAAVRFISWQRCRNCSIFRPRRN